MPVALGSRYLETRRRDWSGGTHGIDVTGRHLSLSLTSKVKPNLRFLPLADRPHTTHCGHSRASRSKAPYDGANGPHQGYEAP